MVELRGVCVCVRVCDEILVVVLLHCLMVLIIFVLHISILSEQSGLLVWKV